MSTKLGENIKLLTFVSIFFLPLSFCTSLWSVSDDIFPLSAFVVTMPILAICTYIISLNLDYTASFWQRLKRKVWPPDPGKKEAEQLDVGDSRHRDLRGTGLGTLVPATLRSRLFPSSVRQDNPHDLPLSARLGEIHVHISRVETVEEQAS